MAQEHKTYRQPAIRQWGPYVVLTIGLLLAAFLLYQAFFYEGFISAIAEWEFERFGSYYPMLTLLVPLAIFALLAWLAYSVLLPGRRAAGPEQDRVFRNGHKLANALTIIATVLGVASVATLGLMFAWIPAAGTPFAMTVGSAVPVTSGSAVDLRGLVRHERTAKLEQHVLLFSRTNYYAPVEPVRGAAPGDPVAYFIERGEAVTAPARIEVNRGIVRANALPGEIVHMYRKAGIEVSPEAMLLQPGTAHARWPFLALAGQFALLAILFAAFAYYERVRLKRMIAQADERAREDVATETRTATA